jgi:uncharacterized iron-regulated membrane protein
MSFRKALFWIHLATGCLAGAVILVMSVTGVLLAYQRQIISWVDHAYRSAPVTGSARLPIEAMIERVADQNRAAPSAVTLRSDPSAPAEVSFGRDRVVLVDVYSGAVLGEASPIARSFFQKIENFHRWLGASNENRAIGRAVTGACNFGFLMLVLSGPFLWMPRRWSWQSVKSVTLFRGGLSGRARDFNWHNVFGIWCFIPLFLIVLSGVVMSYPWANNLLYRITGTEAPEPRREERGNSARKGEASLAGLNLAWTRRAAGSRLAKFDVTSPAIGPCAVGLHH